MDTNSNLNMAGYDLYEITKDEWILHVKNGPIYSGTFKKVVVHAIKRLGFRLEEFDIACQEMIKYNHNGAHFGMYKGFIYTFQKEFKHDRKAS